ncbi:MAG TPA: response regulator [Spirochaetia bacterium]|nr:response regulator [Spirochaetia bacterium]
MRPVLIVDDEPLVRVALRTTVPWERHGFACVSEAANGEEALAALKARPDTALVILDLAMPRMDGLELLRRLGGDGPRPQVIVLSAHDEFPMVREAFKLGVNDYLLKSELDSGRLEELLSAAARRLDASGPSAERTPHEAPRAAMKQELLARLLAADDPAALKPQMDTWGVRVGPVLCLGLLTVCDFELVAARYDAATRSSLPLGVLAITEQVMSRLPLGEVVRVADDEYVLVLSFAERHSDSRIQESCRATADDIVRALGSYLNVTAAVSLSTVTELGRGASPAELYRALAAGRTGPSRLVVRAREHVLKNYQDPNLHLPEVSRYLGVTPNHLSALFSRETGRSFREYVALVRIEAAKRLLAGSSLRVGEVGELVGFLNIEHFSRVFKRLTGVPPHLFAGGPQP